MLVGPEYNLLNLGRRTGVNNGGCHSILNIEQMERIMSVGI